MDSKLKNFVNECRAFQMARFKHKNKCIETAFHIPYSGMCNPDYVEFKEYLKDDVCQLIVELVENGHPETEEKITTLEQLQEAWEEIDYNGMAHEHIDSSLTWQQQLRESEIIISNCENVEEDTGLWEEQQPEEAIRIKAFYTYKNEVFDQGKQLIEEIAVTAQNSFPCQSPPLMKSLTAPDKNCL